MIKNDLDFSGYDAVINTPGAMLDQADALDIKMATLAQSITESNVNYTFKMNWAAFKKGWDDFYNGLKGVGGWFDRLWSSTLDQIDAYQSQLVDWQTQFLANGGSIEGPRVEKPPEQPSLNTLLGNLKWIAIGGVVLYGAVTFGPVVKKMIGGRR